MLQKDHYNLIWNSDGSPKKGWFSNFGAVIRMLGVMIRILRRIETKLDNINSKTPESRLG